jgi:surface polysaccharide O-acyltransferase-like enzyme
MSQSNSNDLVGRNDAIDYFRTIAVFCVVVIHTQPFAEMGDRGHLVYLFLDTISRFAVPFFFMTSGYMFVMKIMKTEHPRSYYYKYLFRLARMYILWQLIFLAFDLVARFIKDVHAYRGILSDALSLSAVDIAKRIVGTIYYGYYNSGYHLWFLVSLIVCIVIIYECHTRNWIKPLVGISLTLHLIGIIANSYFGLFPVPVMARDALFFGLFYTLLGYCFYRYREVVLNRISWRSQSLLAAIFILLVLQFIERYVLITQLQTEVGEYYISTILLSIVLFVLLLRSPEFGQSSYLSKMGKHSVGVYLIHVLFLDIDILILELLKAEHVSEALLWNLLLTPIVFLASYVTYVSLKEHTQAFRRGWKSLARMIARLKPSSPGKSA